MEASEERRRAHELLDIIPAEKVRALRGLLEVMVEPLPETLARAPIVITAIREAYR